MGYGFGFIWSKLGYATIHFGALKCWQGRFGHHRNGFTWLIVPHCSMWCLWRERNSKCFEGIERFIPDLESFFFRTLLDWLVAMQNQSFPSYFDFLDSCNFCIWVVDPLYIPCVLGCYFFYINKTYYLSKSLQKRRWWQCYECSNTTTINSSSNRGNSTLSNVQ